MIKVTTAKAMSFIKPLIKQKRKKRPNITQKTQIILHYTPMSTNFVTLAQTHDIPHYHDPHVDVLVASTVAYMSHIAYKCQFISGSYFVHGITIMDKTGAATDNVDSLFLHWTSIEKVIHFADLFTQHQPPTNKKIFHYIDFGPILPSVFSVLAT